MLTNRQLFFNKKTFSYLNNGFLFLLILFLPTQLGRHFFLSSSYFFGIRVDYLSPTIYFFDILSVIVFWLNFKYLFNFVKQKKVILFFLLLILNSIFSLFPLLSIYKTLKIFQWLAIFLIIKKNLSFKKRGLILNAFLGGTTIELIISLGQFMAKKSIGGFFWFLGERTFSLSTPEIAKVNILGHEALRAYGTFSHPNSLAGFYLLLYFYYLTKNNKKNFSWPRFFLLLFCSFLILISFSKLAISLWFFGNFFYLSQKQIRCWLCFFAKIFTFSLPFLIFISTQTDPLSLKNRLLLFDEWWRVFKLKWILGTGLGAYVKAKELIKTASLPYYIFAQPVHNLHLLLLIEMGVIIFLIFFFLVYPWLKKIWLKNQWVFLMFFFSSLLDHYWWSLPQNFFLLSVITALVLF